MLTKSSITKLVTNLRKPIKVMKLGGTNMETFQLMELWLNF